MGDEEEKLRAGGYEELWSEECVEEHIDAVNALPDYAGLYLENRGGTADGEEEG